jgi:hypothetical protein
MEYFALTVGLLLPWLLGVGVLYAFAWPATAIASGGSGALRVGFGYFVGIMLLTFWMRVLSAVGIPFGRIAIGVPLALACIVLTAFALRKGRLSGAAARAAVRAFLVPDLPRWQRLAWQLLLMWLAVRFCLLAVSVAWQPLYPWDAWTQWATKARVWYGLGHMSPFVYADQWLTRSPEAYFDAAPRYPATVPLLQVWSCIALGRWDDSAMNWPWWLMLIALSFCVYGALRAEGNAPLLALIGAYLVASLPLADVHVALAGYADLPMACIFTLAALSFYRWARYRRKEDAMLAVFFALCCPLIKIPGWFWAMTLIPGLLVEIFPRRGWRIVGAGFAAAALMFVVLARTTPVILNYHLHLDFQPAWNSLGQAFFLFGNWNLLWYGAIAVVALGWRQLRAPHMASLALVIGSGLAFLFVVFAFTNATAFVADYTTVNRATLHLTPLIIMFCVLLWQRMTQSSAMSRNEASDETHRVATAASAAIAVDA